MIEFNEQLLQDFINQKIIVAFKDNLELTRPFLVELEYRHPEIRWIAGENPTGWFPNEYSSKNMLITSGRLALTNSPNLYTNRTIVDILDFFKEDILNYEKENVLNCESILELLD